MVSGCANQRRPQEEPLTEAQRATNIESFDYVWTTIRDQHFDPDLNGADWEGARSELRPKVVEAQYKSEARAAMEALIAKLGQSHFGIIPPRFTRT